MSTADLLPLERVQIDHTRIDVVVVNEGDRLPIGPPVVNACHRCSKSRSPRLFRLARNGRIAFVPEALPLAPRPIPGELISSWLLRVSFANGLTLAQLIEAIEIRFPGLSLQRAFIDDELSPRPGSRE
jgi:hypothetical protein